MYCGQRNPNNGVPHAYINPQGKYDWLYTPTYGDCLELCSRFEQNGEGCFGIHWTADGGHCWLRNSNVSKSDLKADTGSVSALVNRNQMKAFDTACTDEEYQKLAGVDGIAYTTTCNQVYQGLPQCFDEYDCLDPARYFYHAESLEECLGFCVALHPRCRIVSWNPGLQVGFANCWPRFGNQNPKLGQPSSQQGTMHSAAIIEAPTPDSACPQDNVYHSGGQANGTQFDIHCGKLNQGLNITSLQAQNITYCMDACAVNKDGCTAVLYSSSLDDGYQNCHLQKTINEVIDSANATYATIASSDSDNSSSGSSPSKAWIAGPVIGGIAALAAIGFAIFWWRRRKTKKASAVHKYAEPAGGAAYDPTPVYSPLGTSRSEVHATSMSELPASVKYGHNQGPKSEAQELPS
ncbi:unnamed protein product [Alternaria alternata]